MHFSVLGSGSKGNSLYIESGKTAILIDAGFSGKELASRLAFHGRDLNDLNALFLTHEHHDHIQGAGVISRRHHLTVHANAGTFKGSEKVIGRLHKKVEFQTGSSVVVRDMEIRSFSIPHDTRDPVGFVVSDGEFRVACCTDLGKVLLSVAAKLSSCDALVLEFNHDPLMLKAGPYPLALQQRVRSPQGHLANEDAASFLKDLFHERLQFAILAHLSATNNTPELAYRSAAGVLPTRYRERLHVASQGQPSKLFTLQA